MAESRKRRARGESSEETREISRFNTCLIAPTAANQVQIYYGAYRRAINPISQQSRRKFLRRTRKRGDRISQVVAGIRPVVTRDHFYRAFPRAAQRKFRGRTSDSEGENASYRWNLHTRNRRTDDGDRTQGILRDREQWISDVPVAVNVPRSTGHCFMR